MCRRLLRDGIFMSFLLKGIVKMSKYLFTSESVTEGHPDKVCDQISDAILDALLQNDKYSRVACETFATVNSINIMGEISSNAHVDYEKVARNVICRIGYDSDDVCFNGKTCDISIKVHEQSPDIAMGVNNSIESRDTDLSDTGTRA